MGTDFDSVRVASVQYEQRKINSIEEFSERIKYFVEMASGYNADFICFPEFVTLPILTIDGVKLPAMEAIKRLDLFTEEYKSIFKKLALNYNINIIGGSHLTKGKNIAYIFLKNGEIFEQPKIHITPSEKSVWNVQGDKKITVIETEKVKIGVQICYDSEFPELSRYQSDRGMEILFVPFNTDILNGYYRVRNCAQARAIENQCYVILSGSVGNLPLVNNLDMNYGMSAILTPCDIGFPAKGVLEEATVGQETLILSDLNLSLLRKIRKSGSVLNLKDQRKDLYKIEWNMDF